MSEQQQPNEAAMNTKTSGMTSGLPKDIKTEPSVESSDQNLHSIDSLVRKATMGVKIDAKHIPQEVKKKIEKINAFDQVVNAIIDRSEDEEGQSQKSKEHTSERNRSPFGKVQMDMSSSGSKLSDLDVSPKKEPQKPQNREDHLLIQQSDNQSSKQLSKQNSQPEIVTQPKAEEEQKKEKQDEATVQRGGSAESHVPPQELADVVNISPRVTQSQANLVTEEAKPYADPVEDKTIQSDNKTKNTKKSVSHSSGGGDTPTRKSRLTLRSTSSNQKNDKPRQSILRGSQDKRPNDRFVTQKVLQLDWFDVESRMKKIVTDMTNPLSENLQNYKNRLTKQELALQINQEETQKLNSAVFHKNQAHRNIFHIMQDTITKVRSEQKKHIEEVENRLTTNEKKMDDMKFIIENQESRVENFESYLDKNKALIEQCKDQLEDSMIDISGKIKAVHGELTKMIQDIGNRQNKIDATFEIVQEKLDTVVQVNEMVEKRTTAAVKKIEELTIKVDKLEIEKQEKSNFQEQRAQIQASFDEVHKNIDKKENQIKIMENFIDKYVPIRIQQQIGETIQYIGSHSMKQKLENHEMEKFKTLNEDLLDDEDHPELIDLCNKILKQLDETTEHYKKIAKKKGMKYDIQRKGTLKKTGLTVDSTSSLKAVTNRVGSLDGESEMNKTLGATSSQNVDEKTVRTQNERSDSRELIGDKNAMKIDEGKGLVEIPSIRTQQHQQITEQEQDNDLDEHATSPSPQLQGTHEDLDSDDEDNPERLALHKKQLLEWVTKADFTGDLNLAQLANHKFKIDPDEAAQIHGTEGLLKVCKVLMYKIGLTYRRQEIFRNELREEIGLAAQENIKKFKHDLDNVNETINQVHDELEEYASKQQKFREHLLRDVKTSKEQSTTAHALVERWRNDLNQLALVQSCTAEFIQMQTTLDQQSNERLVGLQEKITSMRYSLMNTKSNASSVKQSRDQLIQDPKIYENQEPTDKDKKNSVRDSNDTNAPKTTKVVVEPMLTDTKSLWAPVVNYRDVELKVSDLITIRSLIHQKIHQIMSQTPLYQDFMPGKIFTDLVQFIDQANKSLEQQDENTLPELPSHKQLSHDFSRIMQTLDTKQRAQNRQNGLELGNNYSSAQQVPPFGNQLPISYAQSQFQTLAQRKGQNSSINLTQKKQNPSSTSNLAYQSTPNQPQRFHSQLEIRENLMVSEERHYHQINSTLNSASSSIEDSYLKMLKKKGDQYTRKVQLGGGYEVAGSKKKSNSIQHQQTNQMTDQNNSIHHLKLNSGVASAINKGLPQRHSSLVLDSGEYQNETMNYTQPEIIHSLQDVRSTQARAKQNQTGSFRSGAQASAQIRKQGHDDQSEVATMYLRQGRNSSIGNTTMNNIDSPTHGLGLNNYKKSYSPGKPNLGVAYNMSQQKIPTMQELPLITKQVKGPSSIRQK